MPRNSLHCFTAEICSNEFQFPRVSPGDQPLAKEPEDSGYEIGMQHADDEPVILIVSHNLVTIKD